MDDIPHNSAAAAPLPQVPADQAVAMLEDVLGTLQEGVALWDETLRLVMCNASFRDLVLPNEFGPFETGHDAHAFAQQLFRSDAYASPDGTSVDELAARLTSAIQAQAQDIEMARADGRLLAATSRRTSHGGYLLKVFDKTDARQAEAAEARKLDVVNEAIETLDEGVSLWDADLNFILSNDRYVEISFPEGTRGPAPGENARDILLSLVTQGRVLAPGDEDPETLVDGIIAWIKSFGPPQDFHLDDGRIIQGRPKRTKLGGYMISLRDITSERKAQDQRLAAVNDAVGALDEGFSLWDADMNFVLCNDRYMEIVFPPGFPSIAPGTNALDVVPKFFEGDRLHVPDGIPQEVLVQEVVNWITSFGDPRDFYFKDGRVMRAAPHSTKLGGFLITVTDVTVERNAEIKRLETINDAVGALDEGFALVDPDLNFILGNPRFMELTYPAGHKMPPPGTPAVELVRQLYEAGEVELGEISFQDFAAQTIEWVKNLRGPREYTFRDGRMTRTRVSKTKLGGYLILISDITQERNSEQKARDMLFDAFQSLDEGMVLCDSEMRFLFGNDAWHQMMFDRVDRIPPKPGESALENLCMQVKTGFYDIPDDMTDEDYIGWMLGEMSQHGKRVPFRSADGRHFIGSSHDTSFGGSLMFIRDVTEQSAAEEKRLEAVTDALNAADYPMVLFSNDRKFVLANRAWSKMVEQTGLAPKAGDNGEQILKHLIDCGHYVLPDGQTKETLHKTTLDFVFGYTREFPLVTSDQRLYLGSSNKTAMGGYLVSYRDITEQTRTEQELAQQREIAHQNEKLSALGELLAGVAHELNNPLSVVFGYSQMLQNKVDDPLVAERIDLICQSAERAAKIVKTFLAMARQRPTTIEACAINEVALTALEVSSYSLKANGTEVLTHFDDDAPLIEGDFDQLAQVFSNLIINAGHAVEPQRDAGQIIVKSFFDAAANEVVVEIRDNGPGIPPDIQKRIFEPFFTTKDVGEGTGVGLAFSHRIVSSHDGKLDLRSQPGKGTSFFVRLAALDRGARDGRATQPEATVPGQRRVLVVDDEEGVTQLISDLLTDAGLIVTKSTSPRDALRLVADQQFDVILSDFKMPDMDGQAFYDAVKVIAPQMAQRMGFITGDTMSSNVASFLAASERPFIEKPIIASELMALVLRASTPSEVLT